MTKHKKIGIKSLTPIDTTLSFIVYSNILYTEERGGNKKGKTAASSLLRFALNHPKNHLAGDFFPCKLLSGFSRKEPVYRDFCGTGDTKIHKRNRLEPGGP
jgi:hypothetical protein